MRRSISLLTVLLLCGCANPYAAYRTYPVSAAAPVPALETQKAAKKSPRPRKEAHVEDAGKGDCSPEHPCDVY